MAEKAVARCGGLPLWRGLLRALSFSFLAAAILATMPGTAVRAQSPREASVSGSYDLSKLPVFSKALYFVRKNYFDQGRLNARHALVGALTFVEREVPEILIERLPERDPTQLIVRVNGQQRTFSIEHVDGPWPLLGKLQEIFRYIQPNLQSVPDQDQGRRFVEIESAAVNGMLSTLDPRSVLLDIENYDDMRAQVGPKMGASGIVVELDSKSRVKVKRPMRDTPAWRAGLRPGDRLVRIDGEATDHMSLSEVVSRLRGDIGTTVDLYIDREGEPATKKFTIERAFIRPSSIDPPARVLMTTAGKGQESVRIGYFRLRHFSARTSDEVADALQLFASERVKGIVIDLRGNPGGLYEQAHKVADAFIKTGVIVSMVGAGGAKIKEAVANDSGQEPSVSVAVLVDQDTASASEIFAAAIKNLDRGIVIGKATVGAGSVQLLFEISSPVPLGGRPGNDKLGLKLTTAQFVTAGDVSIQGVGVVPDIEMAPLLVQKDVHGSWIRLQPAARQPREADYEWNLEHPSVRKGEKSKDTISYLFESKTPGKRVLGNNGDGDETGADPAAADPEPEENDDVKTDFLMDFARDLLAQANSTRRRELLQGSKTFLDKVRAAEDHKVSQALEKLGVDWTQAPVNARAAQLQLSLQAVGGSATKVPAGTVATVRGTVKNIGSAPAYRVRAVLESDNVLFDENEMVFGKIAPGESKTYDLSIKVPTSSLTRSDVLKGTVFSARAGSSPIVAETTLNIEGKARPRFAYTYQTIDDQKGSNRDGQVQRGEQVRTLVTVKNIGVGRALHTEVVLRNGADQEGLAISTGRFDAEDLGPGDTKTFSFVYEIRPEFKGDACQLELTVADTTLDESVTDKINVKIALTGATPEGATGNATIARNSVPVRESPVEESLVVGRADKGSVFKLTGKLGKYSRVELENGRPAFVLATDLIPGGTLRGSIRPEWLVTPPLLTVAAPTMTTGDTAQITGHISDDRVVRDVYVRVYNRKAKAPIKKVFYQSNSLAADRSKMNFSANVPLWPGSNVVQVIARGSNDVRSLQTVVVLRTQAQSK